MNRRLLLTAGTLLFAGPLARTRADTPRVIPFQAQVKTSTSIPVETATPFTFAIYTAVSGGAALWTEAQTLTPSSGLISTTLGSITPLTLSFNQPLWIGIAVGSDPEMTPRLPLASVPYALTVADGGISDAKITDVAWSKVTGAPANLPPAGPAGGDLAGTYPNPTIAAGKVDSGKLASDAASLNKVSGGALSASGAKVGIGVAVPNYPLNFAPALGDKISLWGNSSAHYGLGVQSGQLQIHADVANSDVVFGYGQSSAMTETMRVKGNGNVGIGTSAPASKLTVAGVIQSTAGGIKFPDGTVQTTAGLAAGAAAGGDLSGAYPNPIIGAGKVQTDRLADGAVTDAKIAGVAWSKVSGAPTTLPPSGTAGGDLSGSYPDPVVAPGKIDNTKLASDAASLAKVSDGAMTALSGKIGIGTATPGFPLNFQSVVGDKISLWGDTGNHIGFGIQNGLLQIHTGNNTADIVFGFGSSAAMTENMRIKGTGNVGIGTTVPSSKLTVAGSIRSTTGGFIFPDGGTQTSAMTTAGGDLTGTYPNPTLKPDTVDNTNLLSDTASLSKVTGGVMAVSSGRIGIGAGVPATMLAVAGDLQTDSGALIGQDGPSRGPLDVYGPTGVVDQQQTSTETTTTSFSTIWQSFTPAATGSLAGVSLYLGTSGSVKTWTGTLRIYNGEGTTGTLLYTQSVSGDGQDVPQIIGLKTPVAVTGAQVYTMQITGLPSGTGLIVHYKTGDPYAGGRCMMSSTYDIWFQTYMQASLAEPAITVQPMTLNVGIGTSNPKYALSIVGRMSINDLPVGDRRAVQWDPDNNLFYRLTSSRRYKENIQPLVDDFQKLLQAQPKTYTYIGSPERQEIGYIAEDLDDLGLKELVEYDKEGKPDALRYEQMALYLVEIAKSQKARISELEARNADMAARLSRLEQMAAESRNTRR